MHPGRPSQTAQYVTQARVLFDRRGVIDDPYAAEMLTASSGGIVATLSPWPIRLLTNSPFFAALAARIVFFDRQVRDALDSGIDQVVILGAGYDSRAWRFARPGVTYYEVDHPDTQADKQHRAPANGPVYVGADLESEPVLGALDGVGFAKGQPALFVIEGVSMYLSAASVESLLTDLAEHAAANSRLAINFAGPPNSGGLVAQVRQRAIRMLGASSGERHRFFLPVDEAQAFVEATGWHATQVATLREVARRELAATPLRSDRISPDAGAVVVCRTTL